MSVTGSPSVRSFTRSWRRHPRLVDWLVGVAWLLLCAPTLLLGAADPGTPPAVLVLMAPVLLVVAVALALLRRRRPVLAFVVGTAATLPLAVFDPGIATLAAAFGIFAVAVHASARLAWICAGVSIGLTLLVSGVALLTGAPYLVLQLDTSTVGAVALSSVTGILTILVGLFWGLSAGGRRRYIDQLVAHAEALEHDRDQQAQLAALAERSRIARDVHDIVSHSLSVIVRLADGADAVVERDPARAREAVSDLAVVARSSLREMRRVMGVLESTPGTDAVPSGTGFDDLPRLVEVFQRVGLPVTLRVDGEAPSEPGVQMTVFRVVQEALTNALRHASDPTAVTVDVESAGDVTVTVVNDGVPAAIPADDRVGRGLVGMRERAALYGGTLVAALDDGVPDDAATDGAARRWRVRLVLPGAGG